jgi:hypothetical protein
MKSATGLRFLAVPLLGWCGEPAAATVGNEHVRISEFSFAGPVRSIAR